MSGVGGPYNFSEFGISLWDLGLRLVNSTSCSRYPPLYHTQFTWSRQQTHFSLVQIMEILGKLLVESCILHHHLYQGTDARLQLSWLPICHQLDNLLPDIIYWVRTLSPISAQLAQVMTEHELSPETRSSSFHHLDIILLMFMVTLIQPPGTGPGSS